MSNWIAIINGKEIGPLSSDELRALAKNGRLSSTDKIRKDDSVTWNNASRIKGLFDGEPKSKSISPPVQKAKIAEPEINYSSPAVEVTTSKFTTSSLLTGEKVFLRAQLSWLIFLSPLFFLVVALLACMISFVAGIGIVGYVIVGGMFLYVAIRKSINAFVAYATTELVVTDRRVIGKHGFFNRSTVDLLLSKIESVQVEQSLIGRMLDFGSIGIFGTGGGGPKFAGVASPNKFKQMINEQVSHCH